MNLGWARKPKHSHCKVVQGTLLRSWLLWRNCSNFIHTILVMCRDYNIFSHRPLQSSTSPFHPVKPIFPLTPLFLFTWNPPKCRPQPFVLAFSRGPRETVERPAAVSSESQSVSIMRNSEILAQQFPSDTMHCWAITQPSIYLAPGCLTLKIFHA